MTNQTYQKQRSPDAPGQGSFNITAAIVAAGNYGEDPLTPSVNRVALSLVVFSDGTVTFTGLDGSSDTWTFTTSMSFPQIIPIATSAVTAQTGNIATLGNLKGVT